MPSHPSSRWSLGILGAVLVAGCHLVAPLDESKIERTELKTYAWSQESPVQGVDVLIVVDTTDATNLAPLIGPLTDWIQALAWSQGSIQTPGTYDVGNSPKDGDPREGFAVGGMPMLHVGFVSSDLGAADWENVPVPGCTVTGDRGRLIPAAPPPEATGRFLHNFLIIAGDSVLNWRDASDLEEYLPLADGMEMFWAGVMQRPTTCPFQQPLHATLAAVDTNLNMENLGFVRYDAALGLLILAQQDDCSVSDRTLFSSLTDPGMGVNLGPRSPFRCFEYGVQCDDPQHIRDPGPKTGCRDSGGAGALRGEGDPLLPGVYLFEPAAAFAERLVNIKGDFPVVVGSIGGATDPIEVVNAGAPRLAPASDCSTGALQAFPSVRLKAFADALGTEMFYSLCNPGMTDLMWKFNDRYQNQAVIRCFTEALLDVDPATPGLDPDCTVEFVNDPGTATEEVVLTAPACLPGDDLWEQTCWTLRTDVPECGGLPSLYIRLSYYDQGTEATSADVVRARCTVRRW